MIEVLENTRAAFAEAQAGAESPLNDVDALLSEARDLHTRVEQLRSRVWEKAATEAVAESATV
jgi:hypothetical protein